MYTLLILSISLAVFMSSLDGTIVNIALPTISASFGVPTSTVAWVSTAYLLVMAGCVLVFGKISDVIGRKKMFLTGFVIFTVGSLCCGLLPDSSAHLALVISRIFQAIGGPIITAIAPAMITAYIPMEMKGKAMGIIMTLAALGTPSARSLVDFSRSTSLACDLLHQCPGRYHSRAAWQSGDSPLHAPGTGRL